MYTMITDTRFGMVGSTKDSVGVLQFLFLLNSVNIDLLAQFLVQRDTTEKEDNHYGYNYYKGRVEKGNFYFSYTVDLLIDGVNSVPEYCISIEEARKLIDLYVLEKSKYKTNPLRYQKEMLHNGAQIIVYNDYKKEIDNGMTERFEKMVVNDPGGTIVVDTKKEARELHKAIAKFES